MERWQRPPTLHATERSFDYNVPLRSVRGDGAAPSPFYKLSSELSQESLRIPGAVPFLWEQSPGRRKFAASAGALPAPSSPLTPRPELASFDPTKPLAVLLRQPSLRVLAVPSPVPSAIPPIARPPSADHPRSSSARYSVVQRGAPPPFVDNDYDAASDATSDALTATAGGLSVDDSFVSGAVRLSSTASDARDFIMHRFLPAAHAIACDSPQTPSRRFVPPPGATSWACASGVEARPSPLRCVSTPATPAALARALPAPSPSPFIRSQHASLNSDDDDEDDDNEPPASTRTCGMFTFRIRNALCHFRHRASSKQQHKKSSQNGLVFSGPTRLIDILNEDASSSDAEDQRLPNKQLQQKAGKMAVRDRAMPPGRPLTETYKASPFHDQLIVQADSIDESSTYYDVSSRFNSPSSVGATKAARISSPFHADHNMRFAQPAINYDLSLNNNTINKPNPPYLASATSSNFNTSGESEDVEQNALYYNDNNLQQKPHPNNANGYDEGIIKGSMNGPISISVNPVATSRSRLSVTQKWHESNNGDIYQASSPAALLSPPLPKSPTQSWLGRAIPLSTKCPSPLSRMHRAPPPKKEKHPEDSKWEAIVKGSHVQPGHLRFSEELHHQSRNTSMKAGT